MIFFEVDPEKHGGSLYCEWDERPALILIRRIVEDAYRHIDAWAKQTGGAGTAEAEIQAALLEVEAKANALIEKYVIEIFGRARDRLIWEVLREITQSALSDITIQKFDGSVYRVGDDEESMAAFRKVRTNMNSFFHQKHNEFMGVRRGAPALTKEDFEALIDEAQANLKPSRLDQNKTAAVEYIKTNYPAVRCGSVYQLNRLLKKYGLEEKFSRGRPEQNSE